jgi:hypothetical protein
MSEGNLRPGVGEVPHGAFDQREAVIEDHPPLKNGSGAQRTTRLHQSFSCYT